MTDQPEHSPPQAATANVKHKSKGFNPVWVVPILAILIGGWMVLQGVFKENTQIVVTFKDASGIEAGKTEVKLRDIVIGKVIAVDVAEDLASISVTMEFPNVPASRFTDKTRFWIVKPRIGLGGVSGLDTLLSGAYIEADPGPHGEAALQESFVGLEQPDIHQLGDPGTHFVLKADTLGSLSRESPVKYRDLQVGQVTKYELADDNSSVSIDIFIREPYDKLVKADTRFWNISGIKADVGAEGVKLTMESVATLIAGGVAFKTEKPSNSTPASPGSEFILHKSEKENIEEETLALAFNVPLKMYFKSGVKGLQEGAPAEFKGLRIGTVSRVAMDFQEETEELLTYAVVKIEPGRLPLKDVHSHKSDEVRTELLHKFFASMADRGLRAQLRTGNLLTGQSLVVFEMFPQAEPMSMKFDETGLALFPTMPESLENLLAKVDSALGKANSILAKVDALPIDAIGNDIAQTADEFSSIPFAEIGDNLASTSAKLEALPYGQAMQNMEQTLAELDALIVSLNASKGGTIGLQTLRALDEITRAANALRSAASYLERHPEALLRGKKE